MEKVDENIFIRSVLIPKYKMTKIKQNWLKIYTAVIEHGNVQIRFNPLNKCVEVKTETDQTDCKISLKEKGPENISLNRIYVDRCILFITAILEGFKVDDSISILKFKDVFIEKFEISEVRRMKANHLSRAIGRIVGRQGKVKETIENLSKVKFNLINNVIYLMGTTSSIVMAKDAIGRLIQGNAPNVIFNKLKIKTTKMKEKYGSLQSIYDDLRDDLD